MIYLFIGMFFTFLFFVVFLTAEGGCPELFFDDLVLRNNPKLYYSYKSRFKCSCGMYKAYKVYKQHLNSLHYDDLKWHRSDKVRFLYEYFQREK